MPSSQFEYENSEANSYLSNYQTTDKYGRLGSASNGDKNLSSHALNEHNNNNGQQGGPITFPRDSRRGSTHSSTFSYRESNTMQSNADQQYPSRNYNIQRNDDYLINNFRPFNGDGSGNGGSSGGSNHYRQGPIYGQAQPTMSSASNSSRAFPTQSGNYHPAMSQRSSHPNQNNYPGTANTGWHSL